MLHKQTDQLLQERLGIGLSQFKLLVTFRDQPKSQRSVAEQLKQTEASISRQVKLLCDRGLLVVITNPRNRREHEVSITIKGVRLTEAAKELINEHYQTVFFTLDDKQQTQLRESIRRIHTVACVSDRDSRSCDL